MKRGQRILSFVLALILCVSMLPGSALAEESGDADVNTNTLEVQGTNSVGDLLSNTVHAYQEDLSEECYVTDIQVDGTTATVEYQTVCDAELVVAIYNEDDLSMRGSGVAKVTADSTSATVSINCGMPENFVVAAYLLEAETHQPLCEHFVSQYYTTEFQDFLNSTAEDYDASRVLQLEEDGSTNFLVFSEETLLVDEESGINTVTDNGDGTYTIINADDSFKNLQEGDSFSYAYEDGTVLVVVVASAKVNGDTVTVTEKADAELSDVFEYVKIETDSSQGENYVDMSGADSGVTYEGPAPQTYALVDEETSFTSEESFSLNLAPTDKVKLSGGMKLGYTVGMKAYITASWQYVSLKLDYGVEAFIEVEGKWELGGVTIGKIVVTPIPCLNIGFNVELVLEATASISYTIEFKGCAGFAYDSDSGFQNLCESPSTSSRFELEGKIFFGLRFEFAVSLVSEKLCKIAAGAEAGLEVTATHTIWESGGGTEHDCDVCFAGEIYRKVSFEVKLELLDGMRELTKTLAEFKKKWKDFYISVTFDEFDWGTCPHIRYEVKLRFVDEQGDPISGAQIQGTGLSETPVTDKNGQATFWLLNGKYTLSAQLNEHYAKKIITVKNTSKNITLKASVAEVLYSGDCGEADSEISWTLYNNGMMLIQGKGEMKAPGFIATYPWDSYKELIETVLVLPGVTYVSGSAFSECENLVSITIYEGIIGSDAFSGCENLKEVILKDGVTNIWEGAFDGCSSLGSLYIPASVTRIDAAFENCISLAEINVSRDNSNYTSVDGVLFERGDYWDEEGQFWFESDLYSLCLCPCMKAGAYIIPDDVRVIDRKAFYGCKSLTSITIPDKVFYIGEKSFYRCEKLTSVTIPDGVEEIAKDAFYGCSGLTEVLIPDSVTKIGDEAFGACDNLASIEIPDSVTSIGRVAFAWGGLTSVTIPDSVTQLGDSAFFACYNLESVIIGDGVTSIGGRTFLGCHKLTSVVIGDSVTSIDDESFYICDNLRSVKIPESVTSIGYAAFGGCDYLTDVYYAGTEEQWNAIEISLGNDYLTGATIHFNSTGEAQSVSETLLAVQTALEEVSQMENPEATAEPEETPIPEATETPEETVAPEVTEEPEVTEAPEEMVIPEETEIPVETEIAGVEEILEMVEDSVAEEEPLPAEDFVAETVAAFIGTTEALDTQTLVSFTDLVAGERYALLVTSMDVTGVELTSNALLYISQGVADAEGRLTFSYKYSSYGSDEVVTAYGPSSKNVGDAVITVTTNSAGISGLQVVYGDTILTDGEDYRLYAKDNADGSCTVTVKGREDYSGSRNVELYGVLYDANGGEVAPIGQAQLVGESITLRSEAAVRAGCQFLGWATSKTAKTAEYAAGDIYDSGNTVTLYAVWEVMDLIGDVNGSGDVDVQDLVRLMKYLAGMDVEVAKVECDTNRDGSIDILDVIRLMMYLV